MSPVRRHVIFDDAGITFDAGRGATVRVDHHDDGWLVRGRHRAPAFYSAGPHGLADTAQAVRALALQGPRRAKAARDAVDLFTRTVGDVDAGNVDAVRAALLLAWVRRAKTLQPACAPLFDARSALRALVVCGAPTFLREPWLLQDALRFRAARAVLLDVDGLAGLHPSVPLHDRLRAARDWRRLLAADGDRGVRRALHATIEKITEAELPPADGASAHDDACARLDDDIRALRFITLVRPVQSPLHLALLGEMVRAVPLPHRAALGPRLALVQLASDDDLAEIFNDAADHFGFENDRMLVHSLAVLLARGTDVPARGGAVALTRAAFAALQAPAAPRLREPEEAPLAWPPIPPPDHGAVTFLSTTTAVFREGARMHHCVATRIPLARSGASFLFHVEHEDGRATVEVDAHGEVVEAQGPCNRENFASRFGTALLSRWGLGFGLLQRLGVRDRFDAVLLAAEEPPPLFPGERLIASLHDLIDALPFIAAARAPLERFLLSFVPVCRLLSATPSTPALPSMRRFLVVDQMTAGRGGRLFAIAAIDGEGRVVAWPGRSPGGHRQRLEPASFIATQSAGTRLGDARNETTSNAGPTVASP